MLEQYLAAAAATVAAGVIINPAAFTAATVAEPAVKTAAAVVTAGAAGYVATGSNHY